ncbi:hypothetical protein SLS63_012383 [Diaporthe eres]|uniref:Uncharacterized protein n=1 Tax=Diaporthe eres TaxID=83184 RepID=A0ABR1NRH0_DIAER
MQDFENTEPLSEETFQQEMNRPSTLDDVYLGQLSPDIPQNFWQQPHVFSREANEVAPPLTTHGGHMAQADFNLTGHTMGQQSTGFDTATPGNARFGSTPGGVAVGAPGGGFTLETADTLLPPAEPSAQVLTQARTTIPAGLCSPALNSMDRLAAAQLSTKEIKQNWHIGSHGRADYGLEESNG